MIIINQQKNKIVNFDNIESIEVDNLNEHLGVSTRTITAYTSGNHITLGEYENENRAEAVLEEIVKNECETYKIYFMPEK